MAAKGRLGKLSGHLKNSYTKREQPSISLLSNKGDEGVEISSSPVHLNDEYHTLLTHEAVQFVASLVRRFDNQVSEMLNQRQLKKLHFKKTNELPDFLDTTTTHRFWQISPIPQRLRDRRIDLGDITPANTELFKRALNSSACGIQTDLDDGHCPTWSNQLKGLYNIYQFVHGHMSGVPTIANAPLMILRPRAWNMLEHNVMIDGKVIPGPLFDFGLHIFHNGRKMLEGGDGPFLYLSKLESHLEVRLWNDIFTWAEEQLGMPFGSIKACILIESILASFELEQILFEIRDHCAGINCGMWDYSASFINTFGHRKEFILPDRKKYVSMDKQYLKSYLELVIKTCHAHGCHATGGMVPVILPQNDQHKCHQIIQNVCRVKLKEIQAGADGFLVFDLDLIPPLQQMWKQSVPSVNQLHVLRKDVNVLAKDLLTLPKGGFTLDGLCSNISVGILFIQAWLQGKGSFILNGCVEDSATAEISRSQIWQAVRHQCVLEDDSRKVTRALVGDLIHRITGELTSQSKSDVEKEQIKVSSQLLEELVFSREFPLFITTYLYENHIFIEYKKGRNNHFIV
ncbi:uncharacterized protein LOC110247968 isoform X2 [Exaiptasia diaphana]|uniref:malate synthase n=1 Tax=Exaiptasia diaphana TaxID=2652724 RepID=A0A913XUS1_EXADI|nr:uncharacterized protein LOC110247968 isoform X2 [Exaiptasia diaphana]KXJ28476.1 Malate synthase [Exaiptasia diaphana]